ncbi:MAG TPA: type II secretion system F family protein [Gaiellaceae bacterium]|jgi:tight adherence protein C|nr:type II secretion system F family protein [Gaiellaceae bacterium]
MVFVLILAIASLGLAVFLIGEAATLPARERSGSIRRAANYGKSRRPSSGRPEETFGARVVEPLKLGLAQGVLKVSPRMTVDAVSARLMGAGLGRVVSPTTFLASKAAAAIGGVFGGLVVGGMIGGAFPILLAVVFALVGFMVPDLFVSFKARGRRDEIKAGLPDALDLLAVSVEAGLGFDAAIQKLTEHMEGPLVEEFALALGEMRIGETRTNALQKMVDRVQASELASFVRAIIQADQLGISLGRILRVQATDTRNKRQAAAEEKAMKAPIKMLFPTALFIFPAMFIIILGPAFLNFRGIFF